MGILPTLQKIIGNLGYHTDVQTFIFVFGMVFARLVTAIALSPFLGGGSVPGQVKTGLAAIMAALLLPHIAPHINTIELSPVLMVGLLVKEAAIGATIGILSQFVFNAIQMAGALVDTQRGMSQASFFAPQLATNVSLLGQVQFQAALTLFLILNGHLLFLNAMAASFGRMPLLSFPTLPQGTAGLMAQVTRYSGDTLVIALQLSAPVLLALFLVDAAFGVIGKVAAGINVHNESQPVKALVGLGVVFLGLAFILDRMPAYFADMIRRITNFVGGFS